MNINIEALTVEPNGGIPNNPRLPALLHRSAAVPESYNPAATFEKLFAGNGWDRTWRNGIFAFHHYHSNAHEVLGIARGSASVLLGGPDGKRLTVAAGDVVVLPAGFGHCNLGESGDFLVVGAYPDGADWDLRRAGDLSDKAALAAVAQVPVPTSDPVGGKQGPIFDYWI